MSVCVYKAYYIYGGGGGGVREACVSACERACARVRVCVCASVRARARACVCVCVCGGGGYSKGVDTLYKYTL